MQETIGDCGEIVCSDVRGSDSLIKTVLCRLRGALEVIIKKPNAAGNVIKKRNEHLFQTRKVGGVFTAFVLE